MAGPRCGHRTRAHYDDDVIPRYAFGPRVAAVATLLTGVYHLSRRAAQRAAKELLGVELSLGAISSIEHRVAQALESSVHEAWERVRAAKVKHTDGTSCSVTPVRPVTRGPVKPRVLATSRPTGGRGEVFGLDIRKDSVEIRARVSNLPGEFALEDRMTGEGLLKYFARLRGVGDLGYAHECYKIGCLCRARAPREVHFPLGPDKEFNFSFDPKWMQLIE